MQLTILVFFYVYRLTKSVYENVNLAPIIVTKYVYFDDRIALVLQLRYLHF